jgi:uncharacterized protein HemY
MPGFESIARLLIVSGVGLAVLGLIVLLLGRSGLPLGHLPGDIVIERDNVSVYAPLVSCLVASIVLTLVVNLVFWFLRR